ncbi:F-box protein At4g22390-like [Rhododendron vialii]|uniref:F-box protein At4g22390-like n=1 Tax=Rhododendron vialii TaxID=182163 RepID=UPI00265F3DF3|nr:F-box protein At4g22390-like [Rhododendron vialii]
MSVDSRSVSSCNGLVLVSNEDFVNFLFNPSTSEWKELPSPFPQYRQYSSVDVFYPPGLGYVSYPVDYKVVMPVFKQRRNANDADVTIVAVYSLKNNAWRTIQDFPYDPVGRGRGVCFNEHLHFLCGRTGGLDYSEVVVAFDLVDEIFREVEWPASYDVTEFRGHDMAVLEGCLCLLVWSKSDRIDVWLIMDYEELVLRRERFTSISGRVEDEFDGKKLILCNPMQGIRREVVVPGIPTTSLVGDHCMETLLSPNHGGRIPETI